MKRLLILLMAALAGLGCSAHKSTSPHIRPRTPGRASSGLVVGHMHVIIDAGIRIRVQNTQQRDDRPLPGRVDVRPAHAGKYYVISTVRVDRTGRFRISLPPGSYFLVGRPENTGFGLIDSKPFQIGVGQSTAVDLVTEVS